MQKPQFLPSRLIVFHFWHSASQQGSGWWTVQTCSSALMHRRMAAGKAGTNPENGNESMKLRQISACHSCRLLGSTCDPHQWQLGVATAGFAHSLPGAHLNVCPMCFFFCADVTVQRTTPLLLVVHLSRVVCTWLPWKYRAQVLVNMSQLQNGDVLMLET